MRLLTILVLSLLSLQGYSQKYVSAGGSVTDSQFGYGFEAGVYNDKRWISISFDRTPSTKESFVGLKYYYKVLKISKLDTYLQGAMKIQTKEHYIMPEPGVAFVYNLTDRIAPQLGITTPIAKGYMYLCGSLGVNFWIFNNKNK